MENKQTTNYTGKATLIKARAKANATLIAALSGLLLAGGNFLNDFLDRQHQRHVDESAYNAAMAEIRTMKKDLRKLTHEGPPPPPIRSMDSSAMMSETAVEVESESEDEDEDETIEPPAPAPGLVHAPSFKNIQQHVRNSGKAMDFDSAKR